MKLIIDDKIPFLKGIFEQHAEVLYFPGGEIRHEDLKNADGLIVRTRTRCNQKLLEGTPIKFIGTATIGFDHIDTGWCEQNGISWTNAPGCNSGAVCQYITATMHEISRQQGFDLKSKTLGIIGVGHVGKKVEGAARKLGMKVILNDPPRARSEGITGFTDLDQLLKESDIITIHVPLNREGPDKTVNLVDGEFIKKLKPGAILINSSRGEVLDEDAVLNRTDDFLPLAEDSAGTISGRRNLSLILDVWPHEPDISKKLLALTTIATPHIAGYSIEGKYNATRMIVEAVSDFFSLGIDHFPPLTYDGRPVSQEGQPASYDIMADNHRLRESPETFEQQRNSYTHRWEYEHGGA